MSPISAIASLWPEYSGRALADRLGITQAQWQRWTSGSTGMRTDSLVQVLVAVREELGVEVEVTVDSRGEWTAGVR